VETVLTDTVRLKNLDGGTIPSGRYVWRGPADVPMFALEDSRDVVGERIDVVCETPCEAICIIERTRTEPGTIPSTMHGFSRWRVQGNGLAPIGFWCRPRNDENNEHMSWDACWFAAVARPFVFEEQQSKHHYLTHNIIERASVAVSADTAFHWSGGTIAVCGIAFNLTRVGDPVRIESVGVEACGRLLVTSGPTTASQPVTLSGVRYEADQLAADGDCIVMRGPGPLLIQGCRFGGGQQRIPRIALTGFGEQSVELHGNTFGSYGAYQVCPVRAANPSLARVTFGRNVYQRTAGDPQNTDARVTWPGVAYV
jgi:hypothetical protein